MTGSGTAYVEASLGVYSFRLDENTNLEALFDSADQFLYEDKQRKRKDVRKEIIEHPGEPPE